MYKTNSNVEKGREGERRLYNELLKYFEEKYIFQNVNIPYNNNNAQIDIVAVHKSGIFVFEAKNNAGVHYSRLN